MSRTDKDRHYQVADDYRAEHHWKCICGYESCDLPASKVNSNAPRFTKCFWEPIHMRRWWQAPPPKWFIDHTWNNLERARIRDTGREIAKDYNANGDTELEIINQQHRHRSTYYYW